MFSSFSFPNPFRFSTYFSASSAQRIQVESVGIHDVETSQDRSARALKHLLKLNHVTFSICYHNLQYHNHMPHVSIIAKRSNAIRSLTAMQILGSAYILGAGSGHLNEIYEAESKELDVWVDSPGEVSRHDWKDFLGDPKSVDQHSVSGSFPKDNIDINVHLSIFSRTSLSYMDTIGVKW